MELGHLLTRSSLRYPEVSSKVYLDSFCQMGSSISLPWIIYIEAFSLHVISSFSCNVKVIKAEQWRIVYHYSFAYMSIVRPILEYGATCWDPYREGQISALDRVQKKAVKFTHHKNSPSWETLASRRKLSRICAPFKAYSGERAWKPIGDRLEQPHYVSRVGHERKIRSRRRRTDIGKYSFVNRTIQHWNQKC